ncbi:hypothetical protein BC940DRAFT_334073 [Gongronella butleri]|nr:hypothetical protein BC940DRAFT_334073 [Gongronella butleri]
MHQIDPNWDATFHTVQLLANETTDSAFFADDHAAARFEARKGKQRVVDHSCNVILTGGRKYSARGRRHTERNRKQPNFRTMRKRALRVSAAHGANASTQAHHDHLDTVIQGLDAYVQLLQTMVPNPTLKPYIHRHKPMRESKRQRHGTWKNVASDNEVIFYGTELLGRKDQARIGSLAAGRSELVRAKLHERQSQGFCLVIHTDEYLSSQVCNSCTSRLDNFGNVFTLKHCVEEAKVMNRDDNAASCILQVGQHQMQHGTRPLALRRPHLSIDHFYTQCNQQILVSRRVAGLMPLQW